MIRPRMKSRDRRRWEPVVSCVGGASEVGGVDGKGGVERDGWLGGVGLFGIGKCKKIWRFDFSRGYLLRNEDNNQSTVVVAYELQKGQVRLLS